MESIFVWKSVNIVRNVEYLIVNQMLSTLIRVKGNTYSESLNGTEDENKHINIIHDIIYLILPLLGAHTIGNEDNTNFLISFTSFEPDGSATTHPGFTRQGGPRPVVASEDLLLDTQYGMHKTKVRFHSLNDFSTCGNVEAFLDKMRQKIIDDMAKIKAEAAAKAKTSKDKDEASKRQKASLFLQDFPYGGLYGLHCTISKYDLIIKLNFCSGRKHFRGTEKAAKRC